jgi:hypothetical protein
MDEAFIDESRIEDAEIVSESNASSSWRQTRVH